MEKAKLKTINPAGTVNIYGLFQIVLRRFLYKTL